MIFRAGKKKVNDEIPTASMADIAFLLIIYFMVTTTFAATRGLDWALPKDEDNPPLVEKEEAVLIEIQPAGNLVVDGQPMQLDGILDYLGPKLERNPMKPVIIRPDANAPYGRMVDVFDELRGGATRAERTEGREENVEVKNISIPTQREIDAFWF
jgi:biopolymer transport protein ExbD